MIKRYTLLTLILLVYISTKAQWYQAKSGQNRITYNLSVVDANTVWHNDDNGDSISYSIDGGENWTTKALPSNLASNIGGLCAINENTAYVIASQGSQRGIYKTIDAGNSWTKQTTGFNSNSPCPNFIYFWNENDGVAVGDPFNGIFETYTTADGGEHWNLVSSMPPNEVDECSYNSNQYFRVRGDSFYFLTSTGRIFISNDKGYNWTVINTPITNGDGMRMSFDFKDANNGLVSYAIVGNTYELYSTTNGGQDWTQITTNAEVEYLKYIPNDNVYFSTNHWYGLSYSADNGQTWVNHPTLNVGLGSVDFSTSGKIFIGGWGYIYNSTNYTEANPTLSNATIINSTSIDLDFDRDVELTTSQNIENYEISYNSRKTKETINILSVTRDDTNNSLVHIITETDLPTSEFTISVSNVTDLNGFPVINNSIGSMITLNTSSINGINSSWITVFPNPTTSVINFKFARNNIQKLIITDITGKQIIEKTEIQQNETIDLSSFESGIYIIKIQMDKQTFTTKIVKE